MAAQPAYASEIHAPLFRDDPQATIRYWADYYHVSFAQMNGTIKCESGYNPNAVGKLGELGVAQIYRKYHPDVSYENATDPDFSVEWMARQFSQGKQSMWSCWNILYRPGY